MTITVLMTQTRQGDAGATLTAGQTYDLRDDLAIQLVGSGYAVDVYRVIQNVAGKAPDYLGEVANEAAMLALVGAQIGQYCKRTDTGTNWMLDVAPPTKPASWRELAGAVAIGGMPQFGAVRALTDWVKYSVTADGIVITGPCIVKGFRCLTGTSIVGVYDALSATGTNLMPSVTTAANTEYLLAGEGGVLFSTGLYVDWGSGTYVFYALPVEV